MKKLLSVLGAITMISSSAASVVACGDKDTTTPKPTVPDFDFDKVFRQFIGTVQTIVVAQLETAFERHAWKSDKDLPEDLGGLDFIIEHKDQFNDPKSSLYTKTVNHILSIVPIAKINEQLVRGVINNINFRSIIFDKQSPVRDGFQVESITFEEKGPTSATINFQLSAQIIYKDKIGERAQEKFLFNSSISVFKEVTDTELANEAQVQFTKLLNDTNANKYEFKSNSGNLEENTIAINKSEEFKQTLKTDIKVIEDILHAGIDTGKRLSIVTDAVDARVIDESILDASRIESKTSVTPYYGDETDQLLEKALTDDSEERWDEDEFLEKMKSQGSNSWLVNEIPNDEYGYKLKAAQKEDLDISSAINQFNLQANYLTDSNLFKLLSNQSSSFQITEEAADRQVIALYGIKIRGAKFKLNDFEYEFTPINIALRQKTTLKGTKQLYDKFIEDAFHYQKALFNIKKPEDGSINKSTSIILPAEYDLNGEGVGKKYDYDSIEEDLFSSNEVANEFRKDINFTTQLYTSSGKAPIEYIVLTSKKQMFFHNLTVQDKDRDTIKSPEFRTYFFSSGLANKNKLSFTFGAYGPKPDSLNKPWGSLTNEDVNKHYYYGSPIGFEAK